MHFKFHFICLSEMHAKYALALILVLQGKVHPQYACPVKNVLLFKCNT